MQAAFERFFQDNPSGRNGVILALVLAFALPALSGGQWIKIYTSTACIVLAIAGVSFLYARLGIVNLTQIGLMGLGGWIALRLNYATDWPFEVNMIAAGLLTAAFGMLLAIPALRMRGLYFAMITLLAAGGLEVLFTTYRFPNGGEGFWGVASASIESIRRPMIAQSDGAYLTYVILITLLGFLLIEAHRNAAPGRAWAMIRRSEAAAMSAGVRVGLYKVWAFALAGLLAGVAGALLAGSLGLLDPTSFRAGDSIMLFALAVVGGTSSWLGVLIAGAFFRIMPALLNDFGVDPDLAFVLFGAGLLHAVITAPEGIAGQILGGKKDKAEYGLRRDSSAAIVLRDINVSFGGVKALQNISATFSKPITGVIGPNGAGKTTLMNAFSGFVAATGDIHQGALHLTNHTPNQRSQKGLRREFQKEEIAADLTVAQNILVQLDGLKIPKDKRRAELAWALEAVGMTHKAKVLGADLNKYERRMTGIARCLVGNPAIVMLDEPGGGLSAAETEQLGGIIRKIPDLTGARVLLIDHDMDLIKETCEEALVLDFGQVIAFGATDEVLEDPKVKAAYLGQEEANT